MANQLSRTDSSSNQDIRQRFNVKKTIIGVIVLLIGLFHLPEAILLIMDGISLDSILYLIGNILLCLLGIYQLKFRSREMRYLLTKSVVKEKNYSFNLKYLEPLKEMIESGNFSMVQGIFLTISILRKEQAEIFGWMSSCRLTRNSQQ